MFDVLAEIKLQNPGLVIDADYLNKQKRKAERRERRLQRYQKEQKVEAVESNFIIAGEGIIADENTGARPRLESQD